MVTDVASIKHNFDIVFIGIVINIIYDRRKLQKFKKVDCQFFLNFSATTISLLLTL